MNHLITSEKRKNQESEEKIQSLILDLASEDGMVRENARLSLVKIGRPAIDFLVEITTNPKDYIRWEAFKTLNQIRDPLTTLFLIDALDDSNGGIRWIAADGLAKLGKHGIEAAVEALLERKLSIFLRQGVYHVLKELSPQFDYAGMSELINVLKKEVEDPLIPFYAKMLLDDMREKKDLLK